MPPNQKLKVSFDKEAMRLLENRLLPDSPENVSSLGVLCVSNEPPKFLGRVGGEVRFLEMQTICTDGH